MASKDCKYCGIFYEECFVQGRWPEGFCSRVCAEQLDFKRVNDALEAKARVDVSKCGICQHEQSAVCYVCFMQEVNDIQERLAELAVQIEKLEKRLSASKTEVKSDG